MTPRNARQSDAMLMVDAAAALLNRAVAASSIREGEPRRVFHAPEGHRRLTINISHDLHRKLRMAAVEKDVTATDIIIHLLETNLR